MVTTFEPGLGYGSRAETHILATIVAVTNPSWQYDGARFLPRPGPRLAQVLEF